jgi:hypothetical protein
MSQFSTPIRRTGGSLDVYTGLLFVAFVVLAAGVALVAMKNMEHSADGGSGGPFRLIQPR